MRVLPEQQVRVETGAIKFGEDWAGVFIRGDNAFLYGAHLNHLIEMGVVPPYHVQAVTRLIELLQSAKEGTYFREM